MWRLDRAAPRRQTVLLFGDGLLGTAIRDRLDQDRRWRRRREAWSWTDADAQRAQLAALRSIWDEAEAVDVVWAAGKAGFGARDAECAEEQAAFDRIMGQFAELAADHPATTVHLLSSAGGLFEGQRLVTPETAPTPRRPYGHLKLAHEATLVRQANLHHRIYRLTSVYGPVQGQARRGLIATLILNGLSNRVTRLVGHMHTLRDYTFTADIARFVVGRVDGAHDAPDEVALLASGRPASIHEIKGRVEATLGRPLYVSFDGRPSNAADMTFSRATWAPGWSVSDLSTNLQIICRQVLHASTWTERPA